jgi:hypothetical protein
MAVARESGWDERRLRSSFARCQKVKTLEAFF